MLKHKIFFATLLCLTDLVAVADDKTLSLLDIYNQAVSHDPTLASATIANQATQEIIEQGKSLYRPIVNFTAGGSASSTNISFNSNKVPFLGGQQHFSGYQYGVEARQPIFRLQNLIAIDQAKTQVNQADKQLNLTQQNLILRTTRAYFGVLLSRDKVELLAAQKAAILRQLEQAKANFEVGTSTITDQNEAQARYDLIVAQELAAFNEHLIAQRAIQVITGEIPTKLATVKMDIQPSTLEQNMATWLEIAAANELNIQIKQDAVLLAEQEFDRANAENLPTLDAVASYTDTYANGGYYGFGSDLRNGTVGLQLQVPIYQGGGTSSRIRQALLNKQKAQEDLEIARRQMQLDTQTTYLNLNTSIAQIKAYEQSLISSQTQLDSTDIGYKAGIRTNVELLNAQQQRFGAERDLLQARYNYLVNIIQLKTVSGVVSETDLRDVNLLLVE